MRRLSAQPAVAADRFAREIAAILGDCTIALAAAERQSVGPRLNLTVFQLTFLPSSKTNTV
jgi:hypothetical protein